MPTIEGDQSRAEVSESNDLCPKCGNFKSNCQCSAEDPPMPQAVQKDNRIQWVYTRLLVNRAKEEGRYGEPDEKSPLGYFLGRPIIGRDTPVHGGVYTVGAREALVVDEKYGELLNCYSELVDQAKLLVKNGQDPKKFALTLVFKFVKEKLEYDLDEVNKIDQKALAGRDVVKMPIDTFILAGKGVCRHQAILAGYLLEKLKADGYISGNISVDRNLSDNTSGHAWVRYTNSANEVIIMDPAQNYLGFADDVENDRLKGIYRWSYERPEDKGGNRNLN